MRDNSFLVALSSHNSQCVALNCFPLNHHLRAAKFPVALTFLSLTQFMVNTITVVGAGNVGATTAQRIAEKELSRRVVLVDIIEGVPQGKGLDQWQTAPIEGFDSRVIGTNGYDETAGSEIVIITAGIARKPGMSRDDLMNTNAGIVKGVAEQVAKTSPNAT